MSPLRIAHVVAADVRRLAAEIRLGLQQHLPGMAELVEVVHVQAAEKRLQGVVSVGDPDPQGLQFVRVHVDRVGRAPTRGTC